MSTKTILTKADRRENMRRNLAKLDSWYSSLTGAGTSAYDKFTDYTYNRPGTLDEGVLENMYIGNDLAAVVVDRVVDDSVRQGFELKSSDFEPAQAKDICTWAEETYSFTAEVVSARKWSRLYGGGGVFVGADGNQESELAQGAKIHFLRAHDKRDLSVHEWYVDPLKKNYGMPSHYKLLANIRGNSSKTAPARDPESTVNVHESRLPMFLGVTTTRKHFYELGGFGDSVLRRPYDVLVRFDGSWQSMMNLLVDASQGVYKVDGFIELLASNNFDLLLERLALIDKTKSNYRAIVLDAANEDYERIRTPLQEIADILDRAMSRVSAATQTPVTILFGQSPAGLNATGESDTRNWYDQVRKEQTLILAPTMLHLFRVLLAQKDSPTNGKVPEDLQLCFPSIWQTTPREEAEMFAMTASADTSLVAQQIYTNQEIAEARQSGESPWGHPRVDLSKRTADEFLLNEEVELPEEPAKPAEADPTGAPEGLEVESEPQKAALNGAQVTALQGIVTEAIAGNLPLTTAKELMLAAFPISEAGADAILADVPDTFEEKQNEPDPIPPPSPFGEVPPTEPGAEPAAEPPPPVGAGVPEPDEEPV